MSWASTFTRTETDDRGAEVETQIPFMKGYSVFNVEQVEGLPQHYYAKPENPLSISERLEQADNFIAATGANIHHSKNSACYIQSQDLVQMPSFESFTDKESYYARATMMRW